MPTLVNLKLDLDFNRNLGDIIDALKTAALVQFRMFQSKEAPNDAFRKELDAGFNMLAPLMKNHPYFYERKGLATGIVVITSDEGFLGELNTLLLNAALELRTSAEDEIVVLGERGAKYLEEMGIKFIPFAGVTEEISQKAIGNLCAFILDGYRKRLRRILIVYPEFISLTTQKVMTLQALPYELSSTKRRGFLDKEVEIEPNPKRVLESLINLWMGYKLFEIFWSSKQSEYAARIMHLEGSTQELGHINQKLAFNYFRQVHAVSDKTIREVSASRILLNKVKKSN